MKDQIGPDQTRLVVGLRVTDERLERRLRAMLIEEATVTFGDGDDADIVVTDTLHAIDDSLALLVVPAGQVARFIRGGAVACLPDTLIKEDLLAALGAAARGLAVTHRRYACRSRARGW